MRRALFLTAALSALLWIAVSPTGAAAENEGRTSSGTAAAMHASAPDLPCDSDAPSLAPSRPLAASTESRWKSAPVHPALTAARRATTVDGFAEVGHATQPATSAPPYLRHTPLLI